MLYRLLAAGVFAGLTLTTAQAADVGAVPDAYNWSGPYVGLQGGYAWGSNNTDVDSDRIPPLTADSVDVDGWLGGLHAGYLWQNDRLVFGVEGDGEFADIDGDTDITRGQEVVGQLEQDIDWLASLRLRAGFAVDRALFYATGGLAVGGVEAKASYENPVYSSSKNDTEWGWTIGGGVEYAFADDLSARIEYRYTDLGDTKETPPDDRFPPFEVDNTFHAVRVGLSWHFGS
jgi:outer membrane immunogenic protein